MKKIISFFLILTFNFNLFGQDYQKNLFKINNNSLPYRILLPKDFDPNKKYPLLVFLHGAGERGNDNENQLYHSSNFCLYGKSLSFMECFN